MVQFPFLRRHYFPVMDLLRVYYQNLQNRHNYYRRRQNHRYRRCNLGHHDQRHIHHQ
jgi:hypothetical protein